MSTLGQRIRKRREELGLTQTQLAERLGYKSKVSVSNAENDRDDMTTTRISKYADALETTTAYLMGWDEDDVLAQHFSYELTKSRMAAYNSRDFWAWRILEVGDKIPQEALSEIIIFADYLATKYHVTDLTTKEELDTMGVPTSFLE